MKKPTRVNKTVQPVEPMSMTEFRAWLKGIEDMQPSNWSPNAEQWQIIKSRIDSVVENGPTFTPSQHSPHVPQSTFTPSQHMPPSLLPGGYNGPVHLPDPSNILQAASMTDINENGGASAFI